MKEDKIVIKRERLDFDFHYKVSNYSVVKLREIRINEPDVIKEEYTVSFKSISGAYCYPLTNPTISKDIIDSFKKELEKKEKELAMSIKLKSEVLIFDVDFNNRSFHASLRTELTSDDVIRKTFWAIEYGKGIYIGGKDYDELKSYVESEIDKATQAQV